MTMTGAGVLTGTPLYMSPEAMTTPDVADPRSDLYALGAVGYFLLTGRPVFEAATVAEIIGHHLHTEPVAPSRRVNPSERPNRPVPSDSNASSCSACARIRRRVRAVPARFATRCAPARRCARGPNDEAADWWRTFRSSAATSPAAASALSGSDERTMTVDIGDRLTQTAIGIDDRGPVAAKAVGAGASVRPVSSAGAPRRPRIMRRITLAGYSRPSGAD